MESVKRTRSNLTLFDNSITVHLLCADLYLIYKPLIIEIVFLFNSFPGKRSMEHCEMIRNYQITFQVGTVESPIVQLERDGAADLLVINLILFFEVRT